MLINNSYQRSIYKVTVLTAIAIVCTAWVYLLESSDGDTVIQIFNFAIPLFFLLVFGFVGTRMVKREPMLMWTPAAMFLAYTALFKGLGPMVHVFGNEATLAYIQSRVFYVYDHDLLGTHLLNLVGTLGVLTGLLFSTKKLSLSAVTRTLQTAAPPIRLNVLKVATIMIVVGAIIQLGVVYPYKFGLTNSTLPGAISKLGELMTLGIALLGYITAQQRKPMLTAIFWILVVFNIAMSFVEFYKSAVVLAILLPAFGAFVGHRNLRKLIKWIVIGAFLYTLASPIVTYGRLTILQYTGTINQATLTERIGIKG